MEHNGASEAHQDREAMNAIPLPHSRLSRVEVINYTKTDGNGTPEQFRFGPADAKIDLEYQDNGRTLKIFISKK